MLRKLPNFTKSKLMFIDLFRYVSNQRNFSKDVLEYDDVISSKYSKAKSQLNWFYESGNETILNQISNKINTDGKISIIDLACGDGNLSKAIYNQYNRVNDNMEFIGVDVSESQLNELYKSFDNSDINFNTICGNVAELHEYKYNYLHNKFDIVLAQWLFNYSSNEDELYNMIYSVKSLLKNDGICVGSTYITNDDILSKDNLDILDRNFGLNGKNNGPFNIGFNIDNNNDNVYGIIFLNNNDTVYLESFSYDENIYNTIALKCGFKNGFKCLQKNEYIPAKNLSSQDKKLFKEFFSFDTPFQYFVLT